MLSSSDHDLLHLMLSRMGIGVITTDAAGVIESFSPSAEVLTGWSAAEACGQRVEEIYALTNDAPTIGEPLGILVPEQAAGPGGVDQAVLLTRDGHRLPVEHTISPEHDERGAVHRIVLLFRDITQERFAALQLLRQATHDPLTGLLNRHAFGTVAEKHLRGLRRGDGPLALLQIDLDQFNLVHNSCGHGGADDLLQWVAALFREEARETDVVARMGGDIFGMLCAGTGPEEARAIADRILTRLRDFQFTWDDKTFPITASIGLVPVASADHDVTELLNGADHACALAKRNGRNQVCICHLDDEELVRRQREMEWVARIRKHLQGGDVTLFAQPILPLDGAQSDGVFFEVLLRAAGESGRMESAARLIQAAEQFGSMGMVDRWVIRRCLGALQTLPRDDARRLRLCCINLSSVSLRDRSFLDYVHEELSRSRVPPQAICFEITETAVVENLAQARWLIGELQAIGCRFALDDFGSGLASYSHLKDLPVNFVKIGGEFIENIVSNSLDRAMVESINQIARVLGIETIAESVSTQGAFETLKAIGVGYAQGFWVGAPRPLAEIWSHERVQATASPAEPVW